MNVRTQRRLSLLIGFVFSCAMVDSSISNAQEKPDDKPPMSRFGMHMGNLLPNQIEGISEILPMWGFRYSWPKKKSLIELGAMNAQSLGVNFNTVELSIRGDIPMEGIFGIVYAGIDVHYYKAPSYTEYRTAGGGHVGGGVVAALGDYLNFRTDMKFNVNPGVALYIGFGFEMLFPPDGDKGDDKK